MSPILRRFSAVLLAVLGGLSPSGGEAADEPLPRIVLVMDASGSMWGVVEGQPKIDVAREVIRDLASSWDPRFEMGLTVYGHRRKGDCSDIETLLPVAAPHAATLMNAVGSIRPKGKTPLGASLRHAAQQLDYQRAQATVVLVSDGNETCDVDPCAMARALEKRAVDFTAHVIGFGVTRDERAQLQCVADATGGLFLSADDTYSLRLALGEALRSASRPQGTGIYLGAALSPGDTPLGDAVTWRVHHLRRAKGRPVEVGEVAFESAQASIMPKLEPGRYRAYAMHQGIRGELDFVVTPKRRGSYIVSLNAGRLEVSGVVHQSNHSIERGLSWRVHRERKGRPGARIAETRVPAHTFTLPAGRYFLEGDYDGSSMTKEVVVRAGEHLRQRIRFGIGRLAVRAIMSDGDEPLQEPVHWQIHRVAKRFGPPGKLVADEVRATGLHTLPTGHYRVSATFGNVEVHDYVVVESGATDTYTIDLAAGELRVFGSLAPPGGSIHDTVEWVVHSLGARGEHDDEPLARVSDSSHLFVLPAGRYRISGSLDGLSGAADVTLSPGQSTSLNIRFDPVPASSAR